MMNEVVRMSRQELHELAWTKPLSQIAKDLAISDVGLAKLCDRHNIPRPDHGHWMRVRHGSAVPPKPLPAFEGVNEVILRQKQLSLITRPLHP